MEAISEFFLRFGPPLLTLLLCTLAWVLSIFALPGNWIALLIATLYGWYEGFSAVSWWVLLAGGLLAGVGEAVEFLGGWHGTRRAGGSRWTGLSAVVGSFVGAILGAGFGWGLGAIPGTILGAFGGALTAEVLQNQGGKEAFRRSLWAGIGRALGLTAKLGLGAAFLALLAVRIAWAVLSQ